jgi:hypothetical protein
VLQAVDHAGARRGGQADRARQRALVDARAMPILCSAAYCTGVTPSQAALRRLRGLAWLEMAIGVAVVIVGRALPTSAPPMRM